MTKDEFRKQMAENFVKVLEEKGLDWHKEWKGVGGDAPHNAVTRKSYSGVNAFNLVITAMCRGYKDPRWATFVQIADAKGTYHKGHTWKLKKGAKSTPVEYWYPYDLKNKKALTWDEYKDAIKAEGRPAAEFTLSTRYSLVYNADDIEGIPPMPANHNEGIEEDEMVTLIADGMGVPVFHDGGDRAFYVPASDEVHLPTIESFNSSYAYNTTLLHELAHATGHESRLNRANKNVFGSEPYAYEELVAEMSACFMSFNLSDEYDEKHAENHKAYVQSWVKEIHEKPDALYKACKDAQAAADFMEQKAAEKKEGEKLACAI